VRFEEVHRAVEMLQLQALPAGEEHLGGQPLLPTGELGGRLVHPVGHQRQERARERLARRAPPQQVAEHRVELELAPQRLDHVHHAKGPGVAHPHVRLGGQRLLAREDAQDAPGQSLQGRAVQGVGAAEVVDDLRDGATLVAVPGVLGELVVLDHRAVGVAAASGAQVHA
jgi:hypothetical protein